MKTNKLKKLWSAGRPALGGWCSIPSSFSAEIVANIGFDYVCIDMQHGLADFGDLVPMLQAVSITGPTPVVRIPVGDFATAQRALDAGAEGLIFPLISSVADAEAAVAACRYPPAGRRSYGPIRSRLHLGPDAAHADNEIACIVMIETRGAVEELERIVVCPGIDAVYVGPNDLALALGLPVGRRGPEFETAIERVLSVCREHGIPAGFHATSGQAALEAIERGFAMATISTDAALLTAVYQAEFQVASAAYEAPPIP